jgi:glycosyltransferase involved in cell wall biosynthesis
MKISILTPSYNSGKYIERAILSVLLQGYNDFEHIITDGGSTDNTQNILKKYPHLKWVSEKDRGQSDAMNKAFAMSSGDIIGFLNADDEYEPGAFNHVAEIFNVKNPDVIVGNLYRCMTSRKEVHSPSINLKDILKFWNFTFPLNPSCYFYKSDVQKKIGSFPVENHFTMDYWFLLRAYYLCNIYKTEKVLGSFHYVEGHKSSNAIRALNGLENDRLLFFKEKHPLKFIYYLISSNLKSILNRIKGAK